MSRTEAGYQANEQDPNAARRGRGLVVFLFMAGLLALLIVSTTANARSRIKDITDLEGVRDNLLVGYGLVVGLAGTGDSLKSAVFTRQSLIGMLERLGVNARDSSLDTRNVAAVMVTASLPAFARQGTRIDVRVSALGQAKSLLGGTLVVTPLLGADSEVYAVAQGPVAIAGFSAEGAAETLTRGVPTSGTVPNGAIVERELGFDLTALQQFWLALRNPDFTTARRVAQAINKRIGKLIAVPEDSGTIRVRVPPDFKNRAVALITDIEQLSVDPDQPARVVIDEQSGVIVMGENVRISTVAIAQGNLTIRITETPQVSQPEPFSTTGTTVVVPRTEIQADEDAERKLGVLRAGVTLQDLINGLNTLGVGPRDMITILQALKAVGAMQAEFEVL